MPTEVSRLSNRIFVTVCEQASGKVMAHQRRSAMVMPRPGLLAQIGSSAYAIFEKAFTRVLSMRAGFVTVQRLNVAAASMVGIAL